MSKTGILLVNLGTPDEPSRGAVYRYLKQFLLDKRVIDIPAIPRNLLVRGIIAPFRSGKSAKAYKLLWTKEGSPLKVYGYRLAEKVQGLLGDDYVVALAMRYQSPSIESALGLLMQQGVERIVVLSLFPQYASACTGSVNEEVMRLLGQQLAIPELHFIRDFYDHAGFIAAFADRAKAHNLADYDHVLFSYHGLPQRQLTKIPQNKKCFTAGCCEQMRDDNRYCYSAQCYATTRAIAASIGLSADKYTVCFQSRLGKDPWLKPYTSEVLHECAKKGYKKMLVFCPAFVSDCLETTVEVSMEYAEEFRNLGGEELVLVQGLNDSDIWAKAVAEMVSGK